MLRHGPYIVTRLDGLIDVRRCLFDLGYYFSTHSEEKALSVNGRQFTRASHFSSTSTQLGISYAIVDGRKGSLYARACIGYTSYQMQFSQVPADSIISTTDRSTTSIAGEKILFDQGMLRMIDLHAHTFPVSLSLTGDMLQVPSSKLRLRIGVMAQYNLPYEPWKTPAQVEYTDIDSPAGFDYAVITGLSWVIAFP